MVMYTRGIRRMGIHWSRWTSKGKTSAAPAMVVFNNRLYQAIRGTNKLLYVRKTSDGNNWSPWIVEDIEIQDVPRLTTNVSASREEIFIDVISRQGLNLLHRTNF